MKKISILFMTLLFAFAFLNPANAKAFEVVDSENVIELNEQESKGILKGKVELNQKINKLIKEGYQVHTKKVFKYEEETLFISFQKDNVHGLIESDSESFKVFYTELDSNFQIQKLTVEKSNGQTAVVNYDMEGNPIVPDQENVMTTSSVCDWGILAVGTAASAGYGAAFGTFFTPGIGTAVGAGVGVGIGALGIIYC